MDVRLWKSQLRMEQRRMRDEMNPAVRIQAAEAASHYAIQTWEQLRIHKGGGQLNLFSYLSFESEISTTPLIEHCWSRGDRVLAPKVNVDDRSFELRQIEQHSDVAPGLWNIPEPSMACHLWTPNVWPELDWILVPGLAYDRQGGRIGYGGGFYDRFTERLETELSVRRPARPIFAALVLPGQLLKHVPMEREDLQIDLLITTEDVIYTRKEL